MRLNEKLEIIDSLNLSDPEFYKSVHLLSLDKDGEVRQRLVEKITTFIDNICRKCIVSLLNDPDELVRLECIEAIEYWEMESYSSILLPLLKDKEFLVRCFALEAIAVIDGDHFELSTIIDTSLFCSDRGELSIRYWNFLTKPSKSNVSRLLIMLNSEDYHVRCTVSNMVTRETLFRKYKHFIESKLTQRLKIEQTLAVKSTIDEALKKLNTQTLK